MEGLFFILGLLVLIGLFLPWVNLFRHNSLQFQVTELKSELRKLRYDIEKGLMGSGASMLAQEKPAAPAPVTAPPKTSPVPSVPLTQAPPPSVMAEVWEDSGEATSFGTTRIDTRVKKDKKSGGGFSLSFEQNLGAKLPVWVGGIALVCAAFYLVKYSIESGLLGPEMRVTLGGIFGLSLVALGDWIFRRARVANSTRIAQALVGAGLVALYIVLYAATNMYDFFTPLAGFTGMAAVTAVGVILSLRHGQPIAAFALIGGLLTPALIDTDTPNTLVLFSYLFVLFAGLLFMTSRKGWWGLSLIALIGMFLWSGFWLMFLWEPVSSFVVVLFTLGLVVVAVSFTQPLLRGGQQESVLVGYTKPHHWMNIVAIGGGVAMLALLDFKMALSPFDWAVMGLFSVALMAMAYFQPAVYRAPLWAKCAASLALLFMWAGDRPDFEALTVILGMAAIYTLIPQFLMRKVTDPRQWAGMQALSAVVLFLIAYAHVDITLAVQAMFADRFWGIASLILTAVSISQAAHIVKNYHADTKIREHMIGIYALAATAFLSLGLIFEVPREFLPTAFALELAALMWVRRTLDIGGLAKIGGVLLIGFIILSFKQVGFFTAHLLQTTFDTTPVLTAAERLALHQPYLVLGSAVAALMTAVWLNGQKARDGFSKFLVVTTGIFAMMLVYYVLKGVMHPGASIPVAVESGFIERGVITLTYALIGLVLYLWARDHPYPALGRFGLEIFHAVMLRVFWFDLMIANPLDGRTASHFVGDMPLLNGLTLTYGVTAILAFGFVQNILRPDQVALRKVYTMFAMLLAFVWASYSVRQFYHGGLLGVGETTGAEIYTYSVVWLLLGIGLLTLGIKQASQPLRIASLGVMVLVVAKVFLYDAAALEGLYRVFSFLGLGVSLLALSFFYTRYVFGGNLKKT